MLLMAPATPDVAEELWSRSGHPYSVHQQPFPARDPALTEEEEITLVVQVNGKVRDKLIVAPTTSEDLVKELALASARVQAQLNGKQIAQIIYVAGRLVNIVVK